MGAVTNKISSYLDDEELRLFKLQMKARGVTESAYIREMLGFDVRRRGSPPGPRKKKAPQAETPRPKATKSKAAGKKKKKQPSAEEARPSLPFPD